MLTRSTGSPHSSGGRQGFVRQRALELSQTRGSLFERNSKILADLSSQGFVDLTVTRN